MAKGIETIYKEAIDAVELLPLTDEQKCYVFVVLKNLREAREEVANDEQNEWETSLERD